jgi:transcriptional regulator with XRE-family HTH domain
VTAYERPSPADIAITFSSAATVTAAGISATISTIANTRDRSLCFVFMIITFQIFYLSTAYHKNALIVNINFSAYGMSHKRHKRCKMVFEVMKMDFALLGKRIRDERLLLRLTLEQLAELVDKSSNFIGQIERGDRKLSVETLVSIANALGTTVDSLLKDSIRDSIRTNDDNIIRTIDTLLFTMDDTGKLFMLDMIKRYTYHHKHSVTDI